MKEKLTRREFLRAVGMTAVGATLTQVPGCMIPETNPKPVGKSPVGEGPNPAFPSTETPIPPTPTKEPTPAQTPRPTKTSTFTPEPTFTPTQTQTKDPTKTPTKELSPQPTYQLTVKPTEVSTQVPTLERLTIQLTPEPTLTSTLTQTPTTTVTSIPTVKPTEKILPTVAPTVNTEPTEPPEPIPTVESEKPKEAEVETEIRWPIYWGNRNNSEVALTFDDGFSAEAIKTTLEVLNANDITGTFFVVGSQLEAYPDLWQQAVADGHQVCNHTYTHTYLSSLSAEQIKEELFRWEKAAIRVLGEEYVAKMKQEFPYVRFPGGAGHNDKQVLKAVAEVGYWSIAWSQDTYSAVLKNHNYLEESVEPIADEIKQHTVGAAQNGSIVLLHFNVWDTLYLDSMVKGLINKGLQPVTISQVLD